MITTISLVNICHHRVTNFLVMKAFKTYCLSSFQIYNTVRLTSLTVLYVTSPGLTYFITGSLYLFLAFLGGEPAPCGMWDPNQGSNPRPLHWKLGVLTTGPPGKSPGSLYLLTPFTISPTNPFLFFTVYQYLA